jgi:hypothetical protein
VNILLYSLCTAHLVTNPQLSLNTTPFLSNALGKGASILTSCLIFTMSLSRAEGLVSLNLLFALPLIVTAAFLHQQGLTQYNSLVIFVFRVNILN